MKPFERREVLGNKVEVSLRGGRFETLERQDVRKRGVSERDLVDYLRTSENYRWDGGKKRDPMVRRIENHFSRHTHLIITLNGTILLLDTVVYEQSHLLL